VTYRDGIAARMTPAQLAEAQKLAREWKRAIADISEALQIRPGAIDYNNRGLAYATKGDRDRAIADYSEAVRLDPKFANAYNNRGLAYRAKGDNDRAIADFNEAITVDPKLASAYNNRGNAYRAKGDNDRAIADYDEAIRGDPKFANAYINRGLTFLYGGSLAKAQADFKQTNDLNPKYAYAALWLDLAERRNNIPSHLAEAAKQLDMKAWPAPVVRLFLGELSPAQTLAAADDEDPKTKQQQVCEANFYNGELSLLQGAKEEALRLFHLAANDCPRTFREWTAANAELTALGIEP
jgi:lipoprotein NlpI